MTRDEAIVRILSRLGRDGDTALQAKVELEIVTVQEQILEGHAWLPWFLLTENATETTISGEERVELPEDFLMEADDQALWWYNVNDTDNVWTPLNKEDLDFLRGRSPGVGFPKSYALRNQYFVIKPTPDDSYTLKMSYYARDEVLSSNVTNKWLTHAGDLVIAETCVVMAEEYIKDYEATDRFKTAAKRAWDRIYRKSVAREEAGTMRSMGDG